MKMISKELSCSKMEDTFSRYDDDMFNSCPVMCLPREIILKIFTFIPQHELSCSLSRVCKSWNDYAFDPSLWKTINLCNYRSIPSVNLCRLISKASNLRKLVLHGRENISENEVTVFTEYTPHLKHLDLGFCPSINDTMLSIIVQNCPSLESINIEANTNLKTGSVQILSRCKHLKSMNFSHCFIENGDVYNLAKNLEQITCCNIDGISWISNEPVIYLVQKHHKTLKELAIDGAEITDELYKSLSTCTNLTSFESSFCELLTDSSLAYMENLKNLKNLRLRKGTEFSTSGLLSLFSSPAVIQLTSLDLSECTGFEDSCVLQMAKSCGKTLKHLSLCWCWHITDLGATSIVDHCSKMVHLDLTGIDKMTGDCFGRIATEMIQLKLLDLKQCNRIKDELLESVVREKRDLTVINYYGEELEYGS